LIKCDEESVSVTLEIENELEELKERLDTILSKQPNVNKETKLVLS
jgi:tetrahydromethanopterin S-methyltransferase subunit G